MMSETTIKPADMYLEKDPVGANIACEIIPDISKWPASVIAVKRMGRVETDYGTTIAPYQFGVIREQIMPVRIYLREGGFVMYENIKSMLENGWVINLDLHDII
jgi:hypothetical protein